MLGILNYTSDRVEVNALLIQPTMYCAGSCKNCYLKAHQLSGKQTPWEEQIKLFRYFCEREGALVNQITISVDTLPSQQGEEQSHMGQFLTRVKELMSFYKFEEYLPCPQVHITCRNIEQLMRYEEYALRERILSPPTLFDVISLSEIEYPSKVRWHFSKNQHVNYNYMCPTHIHDIDEEVERLTEIGRVVDSIYLILNKNPIGKPLNDLDRLKAISRMRFYAAYARVLMGRLPDDVKKKIQTDGCMRDVMKHERTGYGCSANVSNFQVWPDGSVSGCPYAISGNTDPASTAEGILENIRKARESYDFERCHLPKIHNSLLEKSPDSR